MSNNAEAGTSYHHHHSSQKKHSQEHTADAATVRSAGQAAQHLEEAIRHGSDSEYTSAMKEVNSFRDTHKAAQVHSYMSAIASRLDKHGTLPDVSLYEANKSFDKLDKDQSGRVDKKEVSSFKPENELQKTLLSNADHMLDAKGQGMTKQDVQSGLQTASEKQHKQDIDHLYARGKDGKSLYDTLSKDAQGNVAAGEINGRLQYDHSLNAQDRRSLEALNAERTLTSKLPGASDMTKDTADGLKSNHELMAHLFDRGKEGKTQSLYDKLDKDGEGNIKPGAIDKALKDPHLSEQDKKSLKLLNDSRTWGSVLPFTNDMSKETVHDVAKEAGVVAKTQTAEKAGKTEFTHLFEKGKDGKSLYDKLEKDAAGNIVGGQINGKLQYDSTLSDADRASLNYLNEQRSYLSHLPGSDDFKIDRLRQMASDNGISSDKVGPPLKPAAKSPAAAAPAAIDMPPLF